MVGKRYGDILAEDVWKGFRPNDDFETSYWNVVVEDVFSPESATSDGTPVVEGAL